MWVVGWEVVDWWGFYLFWFGGGLGEIFDDEESAAEFEGDDTLFGEFDWMGVDGQFLTHVALQSHKIIINDNFNNKVKDGKYVPMYVK